MTSDKRKKPSCDSSPISCTSDCSSRSSTASNNYIDCLSTYIDQTNSAYVEFKTENSCYWYDQLTPILLGKHVIGSRAQSVSEIVPLELPRRQWANTSARSCKGKGNASSSRASNPGTRANKGDEDDVYYVPPVPGAVGGKRPVSSLGTSGELKGTRGSKSIRSSTGFEDAISKIGNYSKLALEDRRGKMEFESLYIVIQCQEATTRMEILDLWRIHANYHYVNSDREGERVVFLRSSDSNRFGYVFKLVQEKGLA
ncbi:uncharacterized protein [Coffea arabica]|uniref:Uncharacterized protein n=1 Tax=Coffea arabica TaxID=13443 RepID=A0ABM4UHG0_COFAR